MRSSWCGVEGCCCEKMGRPPVALPTAPFPWYEPILPRIYLATLIGRLRASSALLILNQATESFRRPAAPGTGQSNWYQTFSASPLILNRPDLAQVSLWVAAACRGRVGVQGPLCIVAPRVAPTLLQTGWGGTRVEEERTGEEAAAAQAAANRVAPSKQRRPCILASWLHWVSQAKINLPAILRNKLPSRFKMYSVSQVFFLSDVRSWKSECEQVGNGLISKENDQNLSLLISDQNLLDYWLKTIRCKCLHKKMINHTVPKQYDKNNKSCRTFRLVTIRKILTFMTIDNF